VFTLAHPPIFLNIILSTLVGRFALEAPRRPVYSQLPAVTSNESWNIRIFFSWNVRSSVRLYVHT